MQSKKDEKEMLQIQEKSHQINLVKNLFQLTISLNRTILLY